jgi:hypothetical protein
MWGVQGRAPPKAAVVVEWTSGRRRREMGTEGGRREELKDEAAGKHPRGRRSPRIAPPVVVPPPLRRGLGGGGRCASGEGRRWREVGRMPSETSADVESNPHRSIRLHSLSLHTSAPWSLCSPAPPRGSTGAPAVLEDVGHAGSGGRGASGLEAALLARRRGPVAASPPALPPRQRDGPRPASPHAHPAAQA